MPLLHLSTRRRARDNIKIGGTQYLENGAALSFDGATTIYLSEAVFSETGRYVLFDYSAGTFDFAPFASGQAMLDDNVTVIASELELSGSPTLVNDPVAGKIYLDLKSDPTNGKQFVEGDLTFTGPVTMILGATLYATANTYELFEVTGTITGVNYLTCTSPAGLRANPPYVDATGKKVLVTLS